MRATVARRLVQGVLVVWLVATATFALVHAAPGDAYGTSLEDPRVTAEVRAAWRAQLGLDRPLGEQYVRWLASAARGDLGYSVSRARPVALALRDAVGPTVLLSGTGLALGLIAGILLGTWQAARAGSAFDAWVTRVSVALAAVPDFWLALILLLVVADRWHLVPVGGMRDAVLADILGPWGQLVDLARHLALPAFTIALGVAVRVARYQRAAVAAELAQPYARAARGRGLSASRVLWGHAARSAAGTAITLTGLLVPGIAAGTVFVERIFSWPGMGRLTIEAVGARDIPLVVGGVLVIGAVVALANAFADAAHAAADPRVGARP